MNGPGDTPITNGTTPERPCGLTSLIPTISMSCRGRAEAFARRLQSKLKTLGSQGNLSPNGEGDPIMGLTDNTWMSRNQETQVTNHQPLRNTNHNSTDSFFDFDCELESPGSPVDECEYSRLIETTSTTPQNCAPESGYVCASPILNTSRESSHSSSDGPFFDPDNSDADQRSLPTDYFDCEDLKHDTNNIKFINGHHHNDTVKHDSSESMSDSLPPSQESSTSANTPSFTNSSTFTGVTSASNNTLQDVIFNELHQQSKDVNNLLNGHHNQQDDDQEEEEEVEVEEVEEEDKIEEDDVRDEVDYCNGLEKKFDNEISLTNGYAHSEDNEICNEDIFSSKNITNGSSEDRPDHINNENNQRKDINDDDRCNEILNNTNNGNSNEKDNNISEKEDVHESNNKHLTNYGIYDDEDRPQRVRRCSSLKTGKTPPGTPGRKKIVRFADVLGLDLADVKTFLDEIPTIPKSAYEDLEIIENEQPIQLGPRLDKILMPLFQQPGGLCSFLDMVCDKQVCLENAIVTDTINLTITGCVRVRNLDFHKSVHIRYSFDSWRTYSDIQATYVENSCDGFSDKFSFILFGNSLIVGQRLEFAVRFQCKGQQFWDNNYGANYSFQCLPATNTSSMNRHIIPHHDSGIMSSIDSWCVSFY